MDQSVDLACTVCTEEFVVPLSTYRAHTGVVLCPCCGSTDLVLLGLTQARVGRWTPAPEPSAPDIHPALF